jgi:predicted RNase H-like HicB family nuclease
VLRLCILSNRAMSATGMNLIGVLSRNQYNVGMRQFTLPIVVEADGDGYFVSCPALQGCYSQGDTYEDAVENIRDAIRLHIEDRLAEGEEIPLRLSVSLATVDVAV